MKRPAPMLAWGELSPPGSNAVGDGLNRKRERNHGEESCVSWPEERGLESPNRLANKSSRDEKRSKSPEGEFPASN